MIQRQTQVLLRETYALLLAAQRRSRQASLQLARAGGEPGDPELLEGAIAAHDSFIKLYHRLNLDAPKSIWREARALQDVLGDMLMTAAAGNEVECERLMKTARSARQNLEGSFREFLQREPLQTRKNVGKYDRFM